MSRRFLLATSLIALGVIIGGYLRAGRTSSESGEPEIVRGARDVPLAAERQQRPQPSQIQQQLKVLRAALEAEIDERQRLQDRLDEVTEQLAALRSAANTGTAPGNAEQPAANVEPAHDEPRAAAEPPNPSDDTPGFTERALIAAGVEPEEAARIKRQEDEYTMARMYLRDRAGREGWADSPRFADEMSELDRNRQTIRDEIGDDKYDRYLAASGQPNRVTVNEVLLESPAADAGLQAGDVVLRYGDTRIFAPNELVSETRGGEAGETVRIEVLRQGQRIAVDVPRGPLGIRIAASQGQPDDG